MSRTRPDTLGEPMRKPSNRCVVIYNECAECGLRKTGSKFTRFCGQACARRASKRTRRQRERIPLVHPNPDTAVIETVTLHVLGETHGWECHICGQPVVNRPYTAHPDDPTVDHLIPYSEGGDHTFENTRVTHNRCNTIRGVQHRWGTGETNV